MVEPREHWTVEQLFDQLGAVDHASDRRFAIFLKSMVSGDTVPDEDAQRQLVEAINPALAGVGLELRETGKTDGYPNFHLVATGSKAGRPKQLIFGPRGSRVCGSSTSSTAKSRWWIPPAKSSSTTG